MLDPSLCSPALVVFLAAVAAASRNGPDFRGAFGRILDSRMMLAAAAIAALLAVPKIYISVAAPCEILQDTFAADQLLRGRTAYPRDLSAQIGGLLDSHPPPALFGAWWPRMRAFQRAQELCARTLVVNAHPPLFPAMAALPVAFLGVYWPALLMDAVTLALIPLTVWMTGRLLSAGLSARRIAVLSLLAAGWQPVVSALRMGNLSFALSFFAVLSAYLLLRKKASLAGAAVAFTALLKIYPGILVLQLLLARRWRALGVAVLAGASLTAAVALRFGTSVYKDFAAAARFVSTAYAPNNYSLASQLNYLASLAGVHQPELAQRVSYGLGALLVCGAAWRIWRMDARSTDGVCLGVAMLTTLMCLLSPVVWAHYFCLLLFPGAAIAKYGEWWRSGSRTVLLAALVAAVSIHDALLWRAQAFLAPRVGEGFSYAFFPLPFLATLTAFCWLWKLAGASGLDGLNRGGGGLADDRGILTA